MCWQWYRIVNDLQTVNHGQGALTPGLVDDSASSETGSLGSGSLGSGRKMGITMTHHNEYHQLNRFDRTLKWLQTQSCKALHSHTSHNIVRIIAVASMSMIISMRISILMILSIHINI